MSQEAANLLSVLIGRECSLIFLSSTATRARRIVLKANAPLAQRNLKPAEFAKSST